MLSSAQCGSGRNGYSLTIPQAHSVFLRQRNAFRSGVPRNGSSSAAFRVTGMPCLLPDYRKSQAILEPRMSGRAFTGISGTSESRGNGMRQPRRARPPAALPPGAAPPPVGGGTADLDAYIAKILDAAPPLTPAQRDQLALILRRSRPPRTAPAPPNPQPPGPARPGPDALAPKGPNEAPR